MQLDPIKPKLEPPGSERLKLKCDDPLSRFAVKFNLRRYNTGRDGREMSTTPLEFRLRHVERRQTLELETQFLPLLPKVGQCRLTL